MASDARLYAVKKGHNPSIYLTWKDCNEQVKGYRGNQYESFRSPKEAEQYMCDIIPCTSGPPSFEI